VIVAPQGGGAGARPPVVPVPPVLPAEGAARRRPRPPDWSWADGRASGRPWCWPADGPRPAPLARRASYRRASMAAALAAPYRHARLSAMKLAGDPVVSQFDCGKDALATKNIKSISNYDQQEAEKGNPKSGYVRLQYCSAR
jgi:hypothetical protein